MKMEAATGIDGGFSAERAADSWFRLGPSRRRFSLHLKELWSYRELFYFFVWRDVKVRYQQTMLGIGWAIVQPLITMFVFTIVFHRLGGLQPEYHVPYPLFVTAGLLPWLYFTNALSKCTLSVVTNGSLVTKVYFPRLLIPISATFGPLFDFAAAFLLLIALFLWYGRLPHWHAILTPFFLGMAFFTVFGIGLWLSALNVRYRDIGFMVPFLTQIWLFLTPVVYGASAVPERLHWLISLNPMTGVIDGFRWAVLGRGLPHYEIFAISWAVALALTISGVWYFRRVESEFADVI
jgi:lipopolysaccharide transport system permease protein